MADKPNYRIKRDKIPVRSIIPMAAHPDAVAAGIKLNTQKVYGTETSIVFATRDAGYHTTPHVHDCEQFNIILSGEIWFFVEDQGWKCGAGDVMRIPRNKVHWAWNRGPAQASVIESHSPPLTGNKGMLDHAIGLLGPDEDVKTINHTSNRHADYDPKDIEAVERRAIQEEEGQASAAE